MNDYAAALDRPPPRRYPVVLAAAAIAACGLVDAATGDSLRAEPLYLPAVVAIAWHFGWRHGVALAGFAALVGAAATLAAGPRPGFAALSWNLLASGLLLALPAWLASELRAARGQVARIRITDEASGLLNRAGLMARLAEELLRTERFGGETSIACIGLGGLDRLAEERGEGQVERVLRGFCEALRVAARRTDLVARLDEDEFALLLRGTGAGAAAAAAGKVERVLNEWLLTQGHDLSCRVGFTTAPLGRALDGQALLTRALAHMHERRAESGRQPPPAMPCESPAEPGTARQAG